jgi:hypothetical protein
LVAATVYDLNHVLHLTELLLYAQGKLHEKTFFKKLVL